MKIKRTIKTFSLLLCAFLALSAVSCNLDFVDKFAGIASSPSLKINEDSLYFKAEGEASVISLNSSFWFGKDKDDLPELYYTLDNGKTWKEYEFHTGMNGSFNGDEIRLAPGQKVYFSALSSSDSALRRVSSASSFSYDKSTFVSFSMEGKIKAKGNIMYLLDASGEAQLNSYAFYSLFDSCTCLLTAPDLPAQTLAEGCYESMFKNCSSLTESPVLPATTLKASCYANMFSGCAKMETVYAYFTDCGSDNSALRGWLTGASSSGIFVHSETLSLNLIPVLDLPGTWSALEESEYEQAYGKFYFTALEDGSSVSLDQNSAFSSSASFVYSTDGSTWQDYVLGSTVTLASSGDEVYFRAADVNNTLSVSSLNYYKFSTTGSLKLSGNIMCLLDSAGSSKDLSSYVFYGLFKDCSALKAADSLALPAKTLAQSCYEALFCGCSALTLSPELSAQTLAKNSYASMFSGCSSLEVLPALTSVTSLAEGCCKEMFKDCVKVTSYTVIPSVSVENAPGCYESMFSGCKALVTLQKNLASVTLSDSCYKSMFSGCTALTEAPGLPATQLAPSCYCNMFSGCTALKKAPALSATALKNYSYYGMFNGCSSLDELDVSFISVGTDSTALWLNGTKAGGLLKCPTAVDAFIKNGSVVVPATWDVEFKMFYITAVEDGAVVSLAKKSSPDAVSLSYSTDGTTWDSYIPGTGITLAKAGDRLYMRATTSNESFSKSASNYYYFTATKKIKACGNIMYLLDSTGTLMTVPANAFYYLFKGCTTLTGVPELPATSVKDTGYAGMFYGCTGLTEAPKVLPATSLAKQCYYNMFYGCSALLTAPELSATVLAEACYQAMFSGCTLLEKAPVLKATVLVKNCYSSMFNNCKALRYVETYMTSWSIAGSTDAVTTSWMNAAGANYTGTKTFKCPASLETARTSSYSSTEGKVKVPAGWVIVNF